MLARLLSCESAIRLCKKVEAILKEYMAVVLLPNDKGTNPKCPKLAFFPYFVHISAM